MKDINKKIAELIIKAQLASDYGKYNCYTNLSLRMKPHFKRTPEHMRYDIKTNLIADAIRLANSTKSDFVYWVTKTPDQNGYASILVYFTFKYNGKRYQISFHNPYDRAKVLLPYIGKGMPMRWNKNTDGSRRACCVLAKMYNLNK